MSQSQDLQNLVLGILSPEEQSIGERQDLLEEISEIHLSAQEILSLSRETLKNLTEDNVLSLVSQLAAQINITRTTSYYSRRGSSPGYTLALNLLDYLQEKITFQEIFDWIKKYSDELELKIITQNNDQRMAYLEKQWGQETTEQLAEILKTKKATVQRWLDGGNPSSPNASRLDQIILILFRLHTRVGMSESDALNWFNSHNARLGSSPRNKVRDSSYWGLEPDLKEELKTLGAFN